MVDTCLASPAGIRAVCKFLLVVEQQLVKLDGIRLLQSAQEGFSARSTLVGFDGHEHLALSMVNRDTHVAPHGLVLHLRRIL